MRSCTIFLLTFLVLNVFLCAKADSFSDNIDKFTNEFESGVKNVQSGVQEEDDVIKKNLKKLQGASETLQENAGQLFNKFKEQMGKLGEQISETFNKAKEQVKKLVKRAGEKMRDFKLEKLN
ncbi:uncharacterized protein LOC113367911 [Ctenocephalides felis]|uniref:uncharacterized protein LOC113367911 n=1 Tax=Ctenocephalides felis TaxID=7515 RepID=UPI000E6E38FD|nr:uncharacterized protein LOC113367911 [Ctenocephalides felis]